MNIYGVIMAGGSGTRFWPLSRRHRPKQFLAMGTTDSLITETVSRLSPLIEMDRIRVVAGKVHGPSVKSHLMGLDPTGLIIEPRARNTAPCVALAALHVAHSDPDGVMAVLPADHHIGDAAGYRSLIAAAAERAQLGDIVTLGIRPTRPETGYGYIKASEHAVQTSDGIYAHSVERFVEKPDRETAEGYLKSGSFLWNSGMFFFTARKILEEFERYLPEMHRAFQPVAQAIGTDDYEHRLEAAFDAIEGISLDYGIMEPLTTSNNGTPVRVIPADIGWNDVGHWAALEEYAPRTDAGNVVEGDALVLKGSGNVVHSEGTFVAMVGVDDLVVVTTPDAVLICPKSQAQDVRLIVDQLKADERENLL